jgi:hypothetical protein
MARFQSHDIIGLTVSAARYDLAESFGPHLSLRQILDPEDIAPGYGSPAGDPHLREAIAQRHAVGPVHVVVTAGGMHALFPTKDLCGDPRIKSGDDETQRSTGHGSQCQCRLK